MGIDRLIKAAEAAGYAMANSEDLLVPVPPPKKSDPQPWRAAEPAQRVEQRALVPVKPQNGLRDWWFALSNKAMA